MPWKFVTLSSQQEGTFIAILLYGRDEHAHNLNAAFHSADYFQKVCPTVEAGRPRDEPVEVAGSFDRQTGQCKPSVALINRFSCDTWRMAIVSNDDWKRFRYEVKNNNRYIFSPFISQGVQANSNLISSAEFLRNLLFSVRKGNRLIKVEKGTLLWRAQLGGTRYTPPPDTLVDEDGIETACVGGGQHRDFLKAHDCVRMTPYSDKAKEGRINPKGIPCLYTAAEPRTAMSEVKPAIGSYLTLAEFVTQKNLTMVDFATSQIEFADPDVGPATEEEWEALEWEEINDSF
jgi:hypothetical protein